MRSLSRSRTGGQAERAAAIERQIADLVAEAEQRLHGREGAISAGRREAFQRIRELLQISERDAGQRLTGVQAKSFSVGAVGPGGMFRAACNQTSINCSWEEAAREIAISAGMAFTVSESRIIILISYL
jgi:hypothetical protein